MTTIVTLTGADEDHVSLTLIQVLDGDGMVDAGIVAQIVNWLRVARCAFVHSGRAGKATVRSKRAREGAWSSFVGRNANGTRNGILRTTPQRFRDFRNFWVLLFPHRCGGNWSRGGW